MIKPIDLQTLFLKMNDIGKEQLHQKEAISQQQAQEASRQVQRELDRDHSVNETADEKETDQIRDRQEPDKRKGRRQGPSGDAEAEEGDPEEDRPEKVRDPATGHHIDITG